MVEIVRFDIYTADDIAGTPIATYTDADVSPGDIMRKAENDLGSGTLRLRRDHPDATSTNLAAGNYCKVTFPQFSANPVWGFWLDDHEDTILSQQEESGEFLTRGGPGPLAILGRAALLDQFYNGPLGGLHRGNYDVPTYWTWQTEPYGAILVRMLEEGQLQPGKPLDQLSWDFVRTLDSNGDAWPDIQELIQFSIGTDGLTVYQRLIESGHLFVYPDPDTLELHAYGTSQGVDRSGSFGAGKVRFEKGINIQTELTRRGDGVEAFTHALVVGKDGAYRQVVTPGYVAPPTGLPGRWITIDYPESNDPDLLDAVGEHGLFHANALQEQVEIEVLPGVNESIGRYLPFLHYDAGDTVTLHTGTDPWDYTELAIKLAGFRIVLNEASSDATGNDRARSLSVVLELGRNESNDGLGSSTSGGLGDCPFWIQAGSPGSGQLRMRMRGEYTEMAASGGTSTNDAFINMRSDGGGGFALMDQMAFKDDDYAETIHEGSGHLIQNVSQSWEVDIAGNGNSDKASFTGGNGIVIPVLSADPAGAASEAGQLYYNDVSNTVRWYNGSVWADVGSGGGGGLPTAVYAAAENSSPPTTDATPGVQTVVPWDALYDVDFGSIGSFPAGLGLTYNSGTGKFDVDEDGVWLINLGVDIVQNPGDDGKLLLSASNYGYNPIFPIAAAGNESPWTFSWMLRLKAGDSFWLLQQSAAGSSVQLIDGYAAMDIARIAGAVA